MSNHFHVVLTPRNADLPEFTQKLHSLLSRALNALRGTRGSNIEDGYNIVVETDEETILRHCAYVLANPVAAHLVGRATAWRGPSSAKLEYGKEVIVERPRSGLWRPAERPSKHARGRRKRSWEPKRRSYRGRWSSPERVSFKLVRPPVAQGTLTDTELRAEVRRRVALREASASAERAKSGRKVLSMRGVLRQSWWETPETTQELFGAAPRVASSSRWARREALQRSREFIRAYRAALRRWLSGEREVEFPAGTWLMRRRFGVRCSSGPPG